MKGTGTVYSWVVAHRATLPEFATLVPYTIVLVRLDEQDDILIPGCLLTEVKVDRGLRVRAATERLTDDIGALNWISVDA